MKESGRRPSSSHHPRPGEGDLEGPGGSKRLYQTTLENGEIHHFVPVLFQMRFRHLALITVSLPCFAFVFCIVYSFFHHYDLVTRTHCNVWNAAPSISASIGNFAPQKYVWKVCIALHSAPRLLICQMYHTYMQRVLRRVNFVQQMVLFTCVLNVAEVFSLLLLSVVPSVEDFTLHKLCFGSFLFFSAFFIASSFYLFSCQRVLPGSHLDRQSLHYKKVLLVTNFTAILVSMYCYWRHNTYCEPGMYSIFSLFEYTVVLSNMAYHFTSYYDFYNTTVTLGSNNQVTSDIRQE